MAARTTHDHILVWGRQDICQLNHTQEARALPWTGLEAIEYTGFVYLMLGDVKFGEKALKVSVIWVVLGIAYLVAPPVQQ